MAFGAATGDAKLSGLHYSLTVLADSVLISAVAVTRISQRHDPGGHLFVLPGLMPYRMAYV